MNFDVFDDIEFVKDESKQSLISNCKAAERNILISPYNAIANSRAALEILCKGLIKQNNVEQIRPRPKICQHCNQPVEDQNSLAPNLATMIDTCLNNGLFSKEEDAERIRKNGNNTLHANKGSLKLHVVDAANVDKAMQSVKALYSIMSEVFPGHDSAVFDENKVPFGFYEVVRTVPKSENEVIYGMYNYFVRDPQDNYYYFQVFHRNSDEDSNNELGARGVLTGKRIKEDKGRRSYLLDVHYPSNLLAESDREYIAYSVYSDSIVLTELQEHLEERQIVKIALDLANVLIELKSVGNGISLRNIQPGNVIITPNGDDYIAGIVNMETAKIQGYDGTVIGSMKSLLTNNPYLPREVRSGREVGNVQWDKVDVYSVAKIMMYCLDPNLVQEEIDEDDIYDNFSDDVADILVDIFESSVNLIDDAESFKEKLQDALAEFE